MGALGFVLKERYQFMAELGKGGMSCVYLAKDLNLESYWAVKQVTNNTSTEFGLFKKEVELLASLSHPDIPRIVDRVEISDEYYVVMDFIDGTSLSKVVNINGPQDEEDVVRWTLMLCDVLEYLHTAKECPIIYRDMKPDNVMLTQAGRIKLIDFGIAKECPRGEKLQGESLGTKGYAAPEQYKGASNMLDERTDIYSLGATMFYLVSGSVPQKPPKGVPPLRQVSPDVSEGFEYIVAKCTADAPEDRYQNIEQLREDLDNIEQLTGEYRRKMRWRLSTFVACLAFSLVFAMVGMLGGQFVKADTENSYQVAFQMATKLDRGGDYLDAAEQYSKAIEAKPQDRETYVLLFNALLPHGEEENRVVITKAAIDEMRKRYLDNEQSPMYQDPQLMYLIVKRCAEVEDPEYAGYALNYISIIQQSAAYKNGTFNARELNAYETIASQQRQSASSADFSALTQALKDLEDYTDKENLSPDERLTNYYTLIKIYSIYPTSLPGAYEKAYEIGQKARDILESNLSDENLTFNNIIPLYELVATGQYNSADLYIEKEKKQQAYQNSLEWFGYLEDLNVQLAENLALKKAHAHKGVFDIYNTPAGRSQMTPEILGHLDSAITLYQKVVDNNPDSFLGYVYLTQAYLDKEVLKPAEQQNFSQVIEIYKKTMELRNKANNLSGTAILQFSALTRQLQNIGLEV